MTTFIIGQTIQQFNSTYEVKAVYKISPAFMLATGLCIQNRVTLQKVSGENGADLMDHAISNPDQPEPSYFSTPVIERLTVELGLTDGKDPERFATALQKRNELTAIAAAELGLTIQQYNRQRLGIHQ